MARINNEEEFVQQYMLMNCKTNESQDYFKCIRMARKVWECLEEEFAEERKEARKCKAKAELTEEENKWFEGIWDAWNKGIPNGSKGGKKDALEAFKGSSIDTKELAVIAFKAAGRHAVKDRKELIASKSTPPYFNKWFNSGAWDTRTEEVTIEGEAVVKVDPKVVRLIADIIEMTQSIKQFKKLGQDQLIRPAEERKRKLEDELKQLEK